MQKPTLKIAVLLVSVAALAPLATWAAEPAATGQEPCELDRIVKVQMEYLLALPKDYDQQESWPLLLVLHGAGERDDNLDLVKMHGPRKLIEAGQDFPFIMVSPQCPSGNRGWQAHELSALLDEITEKSKVDQDRFFVTGRGKWRDTGRGPPRP